MCFVSLLHERDPIRIAMQTEFAGNAKLLLKTKGHAPARLTPAKVAADVKALKRKTKEAKDCVWKKDNVWQEQFGRQFNIIAKSWYDVHHGTVNVLKDLINLICGLKNMVFTLPRIKKEVQMLGRFKEYAPTKKKKALKIPWRCSEKTMLKLNIFIVRIRWPTNDPGMKPLGEWNKMAEYLALGGTRGRWLIANMKIPGKDYREKFMDVLEIVACMKQKCHTDEEKIALPTKLIQTFAWLEWKLPIFWQTITKHLFWESLPQIFFIASFWAAGLLSVEQFHIVVKKLARGRKNIMQSFCNNYNYFTETQLDWQFSMDFTNEPLAGDMNNRRPLQEDNRLVVVKGNCLCFIVFTLLITSNFIHAKIQTLFILYSYFIHTLFILYSYFIHTLFILHF
jgi:hypothetical protein